MILTYGKKTLHDSEISKGQRSLNQVAEVGRYLDQHVVCLIGLVLRHGCVHLNTGLRCWGFEEVTENTTRAT